MPIDVLIAPRVDTAGASAPTRLADPEATFRTHYFRKSLAYPRPISLW